MSDSGNAGELTSIFEAMSDGAEGARERLFNVVYDELRRMAHGRMRRERPGQTLQTTALVNEAYLRLCTDKQARWKNRRHFFGAAAQAMRRILVDRAGRSRRKNARETVSACRWTPTSQRRKPR